MIAPIWRADYNEIHKLGKFSVIADTLKQIADCRNNLCFIDGFGFIPKDTVYYRDGYLHPNDEGFELYTDALINELTGEMRSAAEALEFERAADLRDQIRKLRPPRKDA